MRSRCCARASITGFEPLLDIKPGDGSYQFDCIIRNNTESGLFNFDLGDYIGVARADMGELYRILN